MMKHKILNILLTIILISPGVSIAKLKVACIGNSITEGVDLAPSDRYPSVLQRLLGSTDYEIGNYGASGSTLLQGTEYPYRTSTQFTKAKAWKPDVIIVKLGTNDLKPHNWIYKDNYVQDYIDLINIFKDLNPNLKVYVCYPIPAFPDNWLLVDDKVLVDVMIPMIDIVAERTGATVIDLHSPLVDRENLVYDTIHPNQKGDALIAHVVARALCPDCQIDPIPEDLFQKLSSFDMSDRSTALTSSISSEKNLSYLIDKDAKTGVCIPFSENVTFTFEMPENMKLTGYSMTSINDDNRNSPKKWKIEGSNSGRLWFRIEARDSMSFSRLDTKVCEIPFSSIKILNTLAEYKYFRITIEKNNGGDSLNINEIQLFGFPAKIASSITNNGGTVTGEFEGFTGEKVESIIDQRLDTKYCVVGKGPGWIQYNSTTKTKIKRYTLTSCYDDYNRNPKSWQLLGSNDGSKWDILDERKGEDFVTRFHMMEFPVQSNQEYTMFRLKLTETSLGPTFQIAEWQLFATEGTSSINDEAGLEKIYGSGGCIYIETNDDSSKEYRVFSLSGECVKSGVVSSDTIISGCPSGIYFVKLNSQKGTSTTKIII